LANGDDAKDWRSHAAPDHDVHALIFFIYLLQFAAALALYYTAQNLFSILQFYQNKRQPMPTLEKVARRETEAMMTQRICSIPFWLSRFRCANRDNQE